MKDEIDSVGKHDKLRHVSGKVEDRRIKSVADCRNDRRQIIFLIGLLKTLPEIITAVEGDNDLEVSKTLLDLG